MESNPISIPNLCEWCNGAGTYRCGRCHVAYYCSEEHLLKHWETHKKICKEFLTVNIPKSNVNHNIPSSSSINHNMSSLTGINPNIRSSSCINPNIPSSSCINPNIPSSCINPNIPSSSCMNPNIPPLSSMNPNIPSSSSMNSSIPPSSGMRPNIIAPTSMSHNMPSSDVSDIMNMTSNLTFTPTASWNQSNMFSEINKDINRSAGCNNIFGTNNSCIPSKRTLDLNTISPSEMLSSFGDDLLSSENSFWNLIDTCDAQNMSDFDVYLGRDTSQIPAPQNVPTSVSNISNANSPNSCFVNDGDINLIESATLSDICKNINHDLNKYGICVLDKFIGTKRGNSVLNEVKSLYNLGIFEKGRLLKSNSYVPSEIIRSDVMTWVDGTEPYCENIGYLMQKLDLVIATCNKMTNNGELSKYKLHRRTKAMVACYPGNGTHYKKHVDNPNKDGRCITCIYYLNQDWDVNKHGGLLRMYPSSMKSDVAQIHPIFDRMLFFWSDKRNPHEVLPALAMRFAITVWYFDADEREEYLKSQQEKAQLSQSDTF